LKQQKLIIEDGYRNKFGAQLGATSRETIIELIYHCCTFSLSGNVYSSGFYNLDILLLIPFILDDYKVAIQEFDCEILPHPPYSPDLARSDYHLFRSLSPTICPEFPSTATLCSKIFSTISSLTNRRISSSVESRTCPNVGK
jgi:hypothetical protein